MVGYKLVNKGQLVVNRLQANNGLVFDSGLDGLVSPDYSVFEARDARVVMPFLSQLLRTQPYRDHFRRESTGLGTGSAGFLRLYDDRFLETTVCLPSPDEQFPLLRFMEHASGRIRRYIRAKQRLIKLLEEQKQATILRAVTMGLDPSVRLKPSGVECLGDVPAHWDVVLNQRIFKENIRPHNGLPETPLSLSQRDGLIATTEMKERSLQTSTYDNWKLTVSGDLVVNRFKAHLGVFFASSLRGIVSFHYGVFEPRRELITEYFELLYHTAPYRTIYAGRSNGMTVGLQNLSNQNFYNVKSIVPPVGEQEAIVDYLARATDRVETAIQRARTEVALLRDYGTQLISDVVMGRLDVREAATRLSEEPSLEGIDDEAAIEAEEPDEADLDFAETVE